MAFNKGDYLSKTLESLHADLARDIATFHSDTQHLHFFSPSSWLHTVNRPYLDEIRVLYDMNHSTVHKILLETIYKLLAPNKAEKSERQDSIKLKEVSLFMEFVNQLPITELSEGVTTQIKNLTVFQLLGYFAPEQDGMASEMFKRHITLGCDPIPSIFSLPSYDAVKKIEYCSKIVNSTDSMLSLLKGFEENANSIPSTQRSTVLRCLYGCIVSFSEYSPMVYKELVVTGSPLAKNAASAILDWQSSIIPESIPLLAALAVICDVKIDQESQRKGSTFGPLMKFLGNIKVKPGGNFAHIALAYTEFQIGYLLTKGTSAESRLSSVMFNFQSNFTKLMTDLFNPKQDFVSDGTLDEFLSRYSPIEHILETENFKSMEALLRTSNCQPLFHSLRSVHNGFPIIFPSPLNTALYQRVVDLIKETNYRNVEMYKHLISLKIDKEYPILIEVLKAAGALEFQGNIVQAAFEILPNAPEDFCIVHDLLLALLATTTGNCSLMKTYGDTTIVVYFTKLASFFRVGITNFISGYLPAIESLAEVYESYLHFVEMIVQKNNLSTTIVQRFFDENFTSLFLIGSICNDKSHKSFFDALLPQRCHAALTKIQSLSGKGDFPSFPYLQNEAYLPKVNDSIDYLFRVLVKYVSTLSKEAKIKREFMSDDNIKLSGTPSREMTANLIGYLLQYNCQMENSAYFFEYIFAFLESSNKREFYLTKYFRNLNESHIQLFIESVKTNVIDRSKMLYWSNVFYWINVLDLLTYSLKSDIREQLVPYITPCLQIVTTIYSLSLYQKSLEVISDCIVRFCKRLHDCSTPKDPVQTTIFLEKSLSYCASLSRNNKAKNRIIPILHSCELLSEKVPITTSNESLTVTSELASITSLLFILNCIADVLEEVTDVQIVNISYSIVVNLLEMNNWQPFVYVARHSNLAFCSIVLDALQLLFGTISISAVGPVQRGEEINSLSKVLEQARYVRELKAPFKPNSNQSLCERLQAEDFGLLFRPDLSLSSITAAIGVISSMGLIHNLFKSAVQRFKKSNTSLSAPNIFSLFFSSFFAYLARNWDLSLFATICSEGIPNKLIDNIEWPVCVTYWIWKFYDLVQDKQTTSDFVAYCFIKRILDTPQYFGVVIRSRTKRRTRMFKELIATTLLQNFIEAIVCSRPIFVFTKNSTLRKDLQDLDYFFSSSSLQDSINSIPPELPQKGFASNDFIKLSKSGFLSIIGTQGKAKIWQLDIQKCPDVQMETYKTYFESTIDFEKQVIFLLNATSNTSGVISTITNAFRVMFPTIKNHVKNVYVTNISADTLNLVNAFKVFFYGKMVIVEEPNELPFSDYHPPKANQQDKAYASFPFRTEEDFDGYAHISRDCIDFIYTREVDGTIQPITKTILFDKVVKTEEDDGISITYSLRDGTPNVFKVKSVNPQLFKSILPSHRPKYQTNDMTENYITSIIGCLESETIALALHFFALDDRALTTSASNLIEIITKQRQSKITSAYLQQMQVMTVVFFEILQKQAFFDEIVFALVRELRSHHELVMSMTAPLIVHFLNTSENDSFLEFTIHKLIELTVSNFSLMHYYIWPFIKSEKALAIATSAIFHQSIPHSSISLILKSFVESAPEFMSDLFVGGFVVTSTRKGKKMFGIDALTTLTVLPPLFFGNTLFTTKHFADLVFCCCIYALYNEPDLPISVLSAAIASIISLHPELEPPVLKVTEPLYRRMRNPLSICINELCGYGKALVEIISSDSVQQFEYHTSTYENGDNLLIWSVQVNLNAESRNESDESFICQKLPEAFREYGSKALSVLMLALSKLVPHVNNPVSTFLIWPALFCATHSSQDLRCASLSLMPAVLEFGLKNAGFSSFNGFNSTCYISDSLFEAVELFSNIQCGDLSPNFMFRIVYALTKSFEEGSTLQSAKETTRLLLTIFKGHIDYLKLIILPILVYSSEDIMDLAQEFDIEGTTLPEIIFTNTSKRGIITNLFITNFLVRSFSDPSCMHRLLEISACIHYGAVHFPDYFHTYIEEVVARCWEVIETEPVEEKVLAVSKVLSQFILLPQPENDFSEFLAKLNIRSLPAKKLADLIALSLKGVAAADINIRPIPPLEDD